MKNKYTATWKLHSFAIEKKEIKYSNNNFFFKAYKQNNQFVSNQAKALILFFFLELNMYQSKFQNDSLFTLTMIKVHLICIVFQSNSDLWHHKIHIDQTSNTDLYDYALLPNTCIQLSHVFIIAKHFFFFFTKTTNKVVFDSSFHLDLLRIVHALFFFIIFYYLKALKCE